jgi:hypothetical protein
LLCQTYCFPLLTGPASWSDHCCVRHTASLCPAVAIAAAAAAAGPTVAATAAAGPTGAATAATAGTAWTIAAATKCQKQVRRGVNVSVCPRFSFPVSVCVVCCTHCLALRPKLQTTRWLLVGTIKQTDGHQAVLCSCPESSSAGSEFPVCPSARAARAAIRPP